MTLAEMMGIRFPTKLVVGEDPITDLTGTDFTLQDTEALTGSLASLDELLSTNGQLPPAGGDVEGGWRTFMMKRLTSSCPWFHPILASQTLTIIRRRTGRRR